MKTSDDLRQTLAQLNGKGYKTYRSLARAYNFSLFDLHLDHIQADPHAAASNVRVQVYPDTAGFPSAFFSTPPRKTALEDFLTRRFGEAAEQLGQDDSRRISMVRCSQQILSRTSVCVEEGAVTARFFVELPDSGRRVDGRGAAAIFLEQLPRIVERSLLYRNLDTTALIRQVETCEDAEQLRALLRERGWICFVADGSVLPRASGVDPRPLTEGKVVPFRSPASLRQSITLPNSGELEGMAIPEGVTLIVGGGFHGKSTLLQALALGVYNSIPDDGRERVVSREDAVAICAESGRSVAQVDISSFIGKLPYGADTERFTTPNASGSTSQAVNIMEALEAGSRLLLMDEDTSATNFLLRDERMQALVSKDKEPITPLIDMLQALHRELGVSAVMVMGGCGDYLDVADRVLLMDHYVAKDVTESAARVRERYPTLRQAETPRSLRVRPRVPLRRSFAALDRFPRVKSYALDRLRFGKEELELRGVRQLVEETQTRAVGNILCELVRRKVDDNRPLGEILKGVEEELRRGALAGIAPHGAGDYAVPRIQEVAAALNRLRTLACRFPEDPREKGPAPSQAGEAEKRSERRRGREGGRQERSERKPRRRSSSRRRGRGPRRSPQARSGTDQKDASRPRRPPRRRNR